MIIGPAFGSYLYDIYGFGLPFKVIGIIGKSCSITHSSYFSNLTILIYYLRFDHFLKLKSQAILVKMSFKILGLTISFALIFVIPGVHTEVKKENDKDSPALIHLLNVRKALHTIVV